MPSSVTIGPAWPMNGPTYNEADLSPILCGMFLASAIQVMSGVLPGGGAFSVTAGAGMSVNVGSGTLVIASSSGVTSGGYIGAVNTVTNLTVTGSDPVNPRVDLICATVNELGSSSSNWELQVIAGTPAPGATLGNLTGAPSLPPDSLPLAYLLVPATSTSVSTGNISDRRVWTAAQGGIVPTASLASAAAELTGYHGLYIHDRNTLRLARLELGSTISQPVLLPFTPQQDRQTTTVSPGPSVGASIVVCSVSVTTDGSTDIEIQVKWPGLYINNSAAFGVYTANLLVRIDGSPVAEIGAPVATNAQNTTGGLTAGGGGFTHVTESGTDRPSAAAHTVDFVMTGFGDGTHSVQMPCAGSAPATLYVRAVPL